MALLAVRRLQQPRLRAIALPTWYFKASTDLFGSIRFEANARYSIAKFRIRRISSVLCVPRQPDPPHHEGQVDRLHRAQHSEHHQSRRYRLKTRRRAKKNRTSCPWLVDRFQGCQPLPWLLPERETNHSSEPLTKEIELSRSAIAPISVSEVADSTLAGFSLGVRAMWNMVFSGFDLLAVSPSQVSSDMRTCYSIDDLTLAGPSLQSRSLQF